MQLNSLSVTLTYFCNLKCKDCSMCIPYYLKPKQFTSQEILGSLDSLFTFVDHVEKLTLAGGEPLLHPDLPFIAKRILAQEKQVSLLEVVTNGTIMPPRDLIHVFSENSSRAKILVDNYGDISVNIEKIQCELDNAGINFSIRNYCGDDMHCGGWVDFGHFQRTCDTVEDAQRLFEICAIPNKLNCLQLSGGKLWRCSRSRRSYELGITKLANFECLDLLTESTPAEKALFLENMLNLNVLPGCYFCNGMTDISPRVVPGVQLI